MRYLIVWNVAIQYGNSEFVLESQPEFIPTGLWGYFDTATRTAWEPRINL